jgi:arylesterase/paraoxonase
VLRNTYYYATHLLAEIVLHPPSGLLFLACSSPAVRRHWVPYFGILEEDKIAFDDYIATYDAITGSVTRLAFEGFPTSQGYSSHGMDVVPSASNPEELYLYAINHRKPVQGLGKEVGANSVVEIFKTTLGRNTLTHVRTVEDPVIDTPNDIVGSSDGKSFYFTNDHGAKIGFVSTSDNRDARSVSNTVIAFIGSVARVLGVSAELGRLLSRR